MTTATTSKAVTTPADIDFDTRLALASAGMDAIHAHRHGIALTEAWAALAEAQEAPELLTPEPPRFSPHPVLKAAGDLIRARGWTRDQFESPTGRLCALGAIRVVTGGPNWNYTTPEEREANGEEGAVVELLNRIAAETGEPALSVPMWNDRQTNQDTVLKLLY